LNYFLSIKLDGKSKDSLTPFSGGCQNYKTLQIVSMSFAGSLSAMLAAIKNNAGAKRETYFKRDHNK